MTLEKLTLTVGDDVPSHDSVARQFNELAVEIAQTQFDSGLRELGFRNGVFDIFVDETRIDTLTDAVVDTSNEILKLNTQNSGTATYLDPDEDFLPDNAVLSVEGVFPPLKTFELVITDKNGTTVTIPESAEDQIVDTSAIDTLSYKIELRLIRDAFLVDGTVSSPTLEPSREIERLEFDRGGVLELTQGDAIDIRTSVDAEVDDFAVYFDGQLNDYYDATIDSSKEVNA